MRGAQRRAEALVAGAMVVAAMTACTGQRQTVQATSPTTSTTTTASVTAPTPTSSTTSESVPPTAPATSQTPTPSDTPTTPSSTTRGPVPSSGPTRWPKALGEPAQGDPVWAVYLALAHSSSDADIDRALQAAASVGYAAVTGDVACDQGALVALGLDEHDFWSAASLYFATRQDADDFVASYRAEGQKIVGSAEVNLGCLD